MSIGLADPYYGGNANIRDLIEGSRLGVLICRQGLLLALVAGLLLGTRISAQAPDVGLLTDPGELHAGMRGTAYTVFEGDQPEPFEVELLGVMGGSRPKGNLILFRALGDSLKRTGIVAGMSGSPVYVEEKLIGAIAFAFPFSKEPIGMITPIGEMLEALDDIRKPPGRWMAPAHASHEAWREAFLARSNDPKLWQSLLPAELDHGGGRCLVTLSATGWAADMQPVLSGFTERFGLPNPVTAGGGTVAVNPSSELRPGSAVGIPLITGDASLGAIGTLTYVDGDRLVAFGHPLFQGGPVDLPLSPAWIHTIIPSFNSSFKLGSHGPVIGSIRQDRRSCVAGLIGEKPPMLPVTIVLDGPTGETTYRYRIARGLMLEPALLSWVMANSFLHEGWRVGLATIDSKLTIHMNGRVTLSRQERFTSRQPSMELAQRVLLPVPLLLANPYEVVHLDSVAVRLRYSEHFEESLVTGFSSEVATVKVGDELRLTINLRDRQEKMREIPVSIGIPERWRDQTLLILTGGAAELTEWDRERAPAIYQPKDFRGLLRFVEEFPTSGDLLVRVYAEGAGVILGNQELGSLPPSVVQVLGAENRRGKFSLAFNFLLDEQRIPVAGTVTGAAALRVRVE